MHEIYVKYFHWHVQEYDTENGPATFNEIANTWKKWKIRESERESERASKEKTHGDDETAFEMHFSCQY